jgi:thiol-disulfide isomerase/thioredoxin
MTITPSSSLLETIAILETGDLPEVDTKTADQLVMKGKVPIAVMLTAEWCSTCKKAKSQFWRVVRKNQNHFLGVILDVEKNRGFYEHLDSPTLPALVIFENGGERWIVQDLQPFINALPILEKNRDGYTSGLHAQSLDSQSQPAQVFLVAASADSANFVQEIEEQFKYWQERGVAPTQISCFWSVPHFGQYWSDRTQFQALKNFANKCKKATVENIEIEWNKTAKTRPKWMFMYVTSHGVGAPKVQPDLTAFKGTNRGITESTFKTSACQQFFNPYILFDSISTRRTAISSSDINSGVIASCSGTESNIVLLSSIRLADFLKSVPAETRAVITLQACHSAAIIPASLPQNATILAAASADRSSFGCDQAGHNTVYGRHFLTALKTLKPDPIDPNAWQAVHDMTKNLVVAEEKRLGIPDGQNSLPVFRSGSR